MVLRGGLWQGHLCLWRLQVLFWAGVGFVPSTGPCSFTLQYLSYCDPQKKTRSLLGGGEADCCSARTSYFLQHQQLPESVQGPQRTGKLNSTLKAKRAHSSIQQLVRGALLPIARPALGRQWRVNRCEAYPQGPYSLVYISLVDLCPQTRLR